MGNVGGKVVLFVGIIIFLALLFFRAPILRWVQPQTIASITPTPTFKLTEDMSRHPFSSDELDNRIWYIKKIEPLRPRYLLISFPRTHMLVKDIITGPNMWTAFQILFKTPDCILGTEDGIGRGGGAGKDISQEKIGEFTYHIYAWPWDSTINAHNDDWSLQFGLSSVGYEKDTFNL